MNSSPFPKDPFHVRLKYLLGATIACDAISEVYSCAILGYVCTAVNGKCSLPWHTVTSTCFNTAKACEKFNICRREQWKPDGDMANIAWATEWNGLLLGRQGIPHKKYGKEDFSSYLTILTPGITTTKHCYASLSLMYAKVKVDRISHLLLYKSTPRWCKNVPQMWHQVH